MSKEVIIRDAIDSDRDAIAGSCWMPTANTPLIYLKPFGWNTVIPSWLLFKGCTGCPDRCRD